ncbi:MAG: UbiA family prenyltransferase [Candidatus Kapaibacteriota bacterium]
MNQKEADVICVDLDYTLISTDILVEQIVSFLKKKPTAFFHILFWLLKSKQYLKEKLSENVHLDYSEIPIREEVLSYLKQEKEKGNRLVLVTASNIKIANGINNYLKLFDEVYGSNSNLNLKGKNKAKFLEQKFGRNRFIYIGDSIADLPIWKIAKKSLLVSNGKTINLLLQKRKNFSGNLLSYRTKIEDFFKLIRLHQWIKNLLLFLPLILAHEFGSISIIGRSTLAFVSFSLVASFVYIFNDIVDIRNDRKHPSKKLRPIPSGLISAYTAFFYCFLLLAVGIALALSINSGFTLICIVYILLNLVYSFFAKRIPITDIFLLSTFYVLRIIAGSLATHVPVSNWLLAFSIFFFLSLATLKRYVELNLIANSEANTHGRPYSIDSLDFFQILGVNSAFASIIVLILYINSEKVNSLYKSPSLLWFDAFLLLFWLAMLWNYAKNKNIDYDPVLVILRNPIFLFTLLMMIIVWISAIIL